MWKIIVERGRSQMTIWRMRIACWIAKATDTLRLCNTHCFSTTIMVVRTRLKVTLYVHWLSCYGFFLFPYVSTTPWMLSTLSFTCHLRYTIFANVSLLLTTRDWKRLFKLYSRTYHCASPYFQEHITNASSVAFRLIEPASEYRTGQKSYTFGHKSVFGRSCYRSHRHRFFLVSQQMLRWFPRFQVATTFFSCSPLDLNLLVTNFMFCIHVK